MKAIAQFLLLGLFSSSVLALHSSEKPTNLDQLYEQVKHDRVMEQEKNQQREATFIAERNQQAKLLVEAKAQLATQEKRTKRLNKVFEKQEKVLAKKNKNLAIKSGALGELFGTVRQVAVESGSVIQSSMISAELPGRSTFLSDVAERKQQPTIGEIRQVWLTLQQEMTESAKVKSFTHAVITVEGIVEEKQVDRKSVV